METKQTCSSHYRFRATAMADHPWNGRVFTCEREAPHKDVNHTAHVDGKEDQEVNWTDAEEMRAA